ncbi:MAG: hypothetical protein JXA71_15430, partial [Chitinispirillaceae bacterium]|nr:hypothetical protein [Chitinispirillaceae bacterium]
MAKTLLTVVLIPLLLSASSIITHDYTFTEPVIGNGSVSIEGCSPMYADFSPKVAVRPVTLLLPAGHKALSLDVEYGEPVLLSGTYTLDPHIPAVNKMHKRLNRVPDRYRSLIYERNAFFPDAAARAWFRVQYKNGHPLLISSVNPVQYNPVTGQVRYYKKISVRATTTPSIALSKSAGDELLGPQCTPAIQSQLSELVDNPEAAAFVPMTAKTDSSYEYLVITTDALKNNFADFIAFNRRRAMRTK